jgi:hypothetical protein
MALLTLRLPPGRPAGRPRNDPTALRVHSGVLPLLAEWTDHTHAVLADLGYESERAARLPRSSIPAAAS